MAGVVHIIGDHHIAGLLRVTAAADTAEIAAALANVRIEI